MMGRSQIKKHLQVPLAVIAGGFVWIVFDSFALGILTSAAALFLIKRDKEEDARE